VNSRGRGWARRRRLAAASSSRVSFPVAVGP
jgi:hypothetical protein